MSKFRFMAAGLLPRFFLLFFLGDNFQLVLDVYSLHVPDGFCMDNNNSGDNHRIPAIITSKRVNIKCFFVSFLKRDGEGQLFWSLIGRRRL